MKKKLTIGQTPLDGIDLRQLSFDELYHQYWKLLYEVAFAKTGSKEDAFDIVQDLFIYIWENRARIQVTSSLKAYLLVCLRNLIFARLKQNGVTRKVMQNFVLFAESNEMSGADLARHEKRKEDSERFLHEAIEELPEKLRRIVKERWYHKKAIAQISQELSISHQTVKNSLTIAVSRIRQRAKTANIEIVLVLPLVGWWTWVSV